MTNSSGQPSPDGAASGGGNWQDWAKPFEETPAGQLGGPAGSHSDPVTGPMPGTGHAGSPAPATTPLPGSAPTPLPPSEQERPAQRRRRRPGPFRRVIAALLIVTAAVAWVAAVAAAWSFYTLSNTDRFVAAVGPVIEDPAVVDVLAERTAEAVVSSVDLRGQLAQALPPPADLLAGPISRSTEAAVRDSTAALLATEAGRQAWQDTLRAAQPEIIAALKGEDGALAESSSGELRVSLGPLIDAAITQSEQLLSDLLGVEVDLPEVSAEDLQAFGDAIERQFGVTVSEDLGTVTVLTAAELSQAQDAYAAARLTVWVLPVLALALTVLAVYFAARRVRAVLWIAGLAAVGVGLAVLVADNLRGRVVGSVPDEAVAQAVGNAFADVFNRLSLVGWVVLGTGLVLALGLALTGGPGRSAGEQHHPAGTL